jgi:hypothetical protein
MILTIRQRTIIAAVSQAVLICIICAFVYISFRTIVSKLRAIEIIDDLNISVLEMRKAEKNYFLYKDVSAINDLISLGRRIGAISQPIWGKKPIWTLRPKSTNMWKWPILSNNIPR